MDTSYWERTIRDCFANCCLSAVFVMTGFLLLKLWMPDTSMAIGIVIGVSLMLSFSKGWFLTRHRFSMSLIAEFALMLGLAMGTHFALGTGAHGLKASQYELVGLVVAFSLGRLARKFYEISSIFHDLS